MIATTIADVPTRTVPAVAPDTPAATAAGRLRETGAPAVVVVDEGAVVGLVTRAAFLPVVDAGSPPSVVAASALAPYVPRYRLFGTGPTAGTAVASPEPEPELDADGTTVPTAAGSTSQWASTDRSLPRRRPPCEPSGRRFASPRRHASSRSPASPRSWYSKRERSRAS